MSYISITILTILDSNNNPITKYKPDLRLCSEVPLSSLTRFLPQNCLLLGTKQFVGRCGVVGSTLAFGSSIGHGYECEHRLFSHHIGISLQQADITGVMLTGRPSSVPAVVHSVSYPPGKANRETTYQW